MQDRPTINPQKIRAREEKEDAQHEILYFHKTIFLAGVLKIWDYCKPSGYKVWSKDSNPVYSKDLWVQWRGHSKGAVQRLLKPTNSVVVLLLLLLYMSVNVSVDELYPTATTNGQYFYPSNKSWLKFDRCNNQDPPTTKQAKQNHK